MSGDGLNFLPQTFQDGIDALVAYAIRDFIVGVNVFDDLVTAADFPAPACEGTRSAGIPRGGNPGTSLSSTHTTCFWWSIKMCAAVMGFSRRMKSANREEKTSCGPAHNPPTRPRTLTAA